MFNSKYMRNVDRITIVTPMFSYKIVHRMQLKKEQNNSATRARAMQNQLEPKWHRTTNANVILILCVTNISQSDLLTGPTVDVYIHNIEILVLLRMPTKSWYIQTQIQPQKATWLQKHKTLTSHLPPLTSHISPLTLTCDLSPVTSHVWLSPVTTKKTA